MSANGARPKSVWQDLTIAVPVYSRPKELRQLLTSISDMDVLPGEILLCEDHSADRQVISQIASEWKVTLAAEGCELNYVENERNLGYDGNVRGLFERATRPWVMLLGNDDVVLPGAMSAIQHFLTEHPKVQMVSRTFVRFTGDIENVVGVTRLSSRDRVYTKESDAPGMILRLCGFVGGLLVSRQWARSFSTSQYDGTLYYQIYLAAEAFSADGIGYISTPLVGSRTGNPPLFGSATAEKGAHVPGAYSPKARASMWQGVLRISEDVERRTLVPLLHGIRWELAGRQSFHVFEMVLVQGRRSTLELIGQFRSLGLMSHPLPWSLSLLGLILGRHSSVFFALIRSAQKWRVRRKRDPLVARHSA